MEMAYEWEVTPLNMNAYFITLPVQKLLIKTWVHVSRSNNKDHIDDLVY